MRRTPFALVVALAAMALPSFAAELAGVTLPDQERVDGKTLVLNGLGLREATFLRVDVYVAGLYLEAKSDDAAEIIDSAGAKRLVMRFVRSVGRDDLVNAWKEGFDKNAPDARTAREGLAALNAAMVDVKDGDTITLTQLPGDGVVVAVNGKASEPIPGEAFARALWSVWLGRKPPNPGLKEGLLGQN